MCRKSLNHIFELWIPSRNIVCWIIKQSELVGEYFAVEMICHGSRLAQLEYSSFV